MAAADAFDGGWQVRCENTFLTFHDDSSVALERAMRSTSCPPARCTKQGSVQLLQTALPRANTRVAPVEVNAPHEKSPNNTKGQVVTGATHYVVKEDAFICLRPPFPRSLEVKKDRRDTEGKEYIMEQKQDNKVGKCKWGKKTKKASKQKKRAPENVVILKSIPSRMVEVEMLMVISSLGFYDALVNFNMPMRVVPDGRSLNKGFAFVEFADRSICQQFRDVASGYQFKDRVTTRVLEAYLSTTSS